MPRSIECGCFDSWPRALFGGPLWGNRWVKQALIDEAGISASDKAVVVAGVVVDPDNQFSEAERAVYNAIRNHIPKHLQDDFSFHAKDVYGKLRKKEKWEWSDCNRITDAWLQIALDLKLPVVLTWVAKPQKLDGQYELNDEAHMLAFAECAQGIDEFMRSYAKEEVASLIAEDCPQMRGKLRHIISKLARGDLVGQLNFSERITNIKGGVLFAQKSDSPILQIADAYAFSFSRYVNNRPGGSRFWMKMNGSPKIMASLNIPESGGGRVLLWPN